jgi:hypothetical protein
MVHLDGTAKTVGSVEERAEAGDNHDTLAAGYRNQGRVGTVVPTQRDGHAIDQNRCLTRTRAANREFHLATRIEPDVDERRLAKGFVQEWGG